MKRLMFQKQTKQTITHAVLAVIPGLYEIHLFPKCPLTINNFAFGKMRPGAGLMPCRGYV